MGLEPPMLPKGALEFMEKPVLKKPAPPSTQSENRGNVGSEIPAPGTQAIEPSSPQFDSLEDLRTHMGDCRRCDLHNGRKQMVFGEGNPEARLIFVGEGPGVDEDREGRPFVGKSGQLLTRIIENGMGLTRDMVYICNVVKCHPPGNRDPNPDEIKVCLPFLKAQLSIIKPDVICALGRVACQALMEGDFKITRDRGKWRTYHGIPLMPTFHPAYLLRNAAAKRPVWDDVKSIMNKLGLEVTQNG
ncbi:MAG: uracil-DNA glycosylase [Deltaproteobacteria bacterium]|nr:uracil-DNA glycosylase [Deltaproteobacteria bacterium]